MVMIPCGNPSLLCLFYRG